MKKILLLALITPLLVIGCKSASPVEPEDDFNVNFTMSSFINTQEDGHYHLTCEYKDSYFDGDAKVLSKEIAMISYASSVANDLKENIRSFVNELGMEDITISSHYDNPQPHGIEYTIAHKKISDKNMVGLFIRGFEYNKEWISNLDMGTEGNHHGFELAATTVYQALKEYINSHNLTDLKLWVTGYSRGGAVANVLAYLLMNQTDIAVAQSDMFVYTFEAPKGLLIENAVAYPNVFNFVNEADVIPLVAPREYGFARCGIDINIYNKKVDDLIRGLDYDIKLSKFSPDSLLYPTESDFAQYIITTLVKERETMCISTREQFVATVQNSLGYLLSGFFSLSFAGQNAFIAAASESLIDLFEEDGLYNLFKRIFDEYHVDYEDSVLKESCDVAFQFVLAMMSDVIAVAGNLGRVGNMHMPEVNYVLLKNYCK